MQCSAISRNLFLFIFRSEKAALGKSSLPSRPIAAPSMIKLHLLAADIVDHLAVAEHLAAADPCVDRPARQAGAVPGGPAALGELVFVPHRESPLHVDEDQVRVVA